MKKLLLVLIMIGLVVGLFVGCLPTAPIEPEPANRVVMIELYMGIGCPHCEDVEPILEQLVEEYGYDQVVLVEEAAGGEYSTTEISERYKEFYFPNSADWGIPNILFDGLNDRIQGYSSSDPANPDAFIAEAKNIINTELAKGAKILITVDSRNSDTNTTTISGTIENVSSSTLNNLEINGMIFIEREEESLKYSVTDIFDEQKVEITSLAPEESLDFSFTLEGINWEGDNVHGVIFVQAPESSTKEILQAAYVE
jgi:thiol-disulfide isomerase/thioredoxin